MKCGNNRVNVMVKISAKKEVLRMESMPRLGVFEFFGLRVFGLDGTSISAVSGASVCGCEWHEHAQKHTSIRIRGIRRRLKFVEEIQFVEDLNS